MNDKYGYLYLILSAIFGGGIGFYIADRLFNSELDEIKESYVRRAEHLDKMLKNEKREFSWKLVEQYNELKNTLIIKNIMSEQEVLDIFNAIDTEFNEGPFAAEVEEKHVNDAHIMPDYMDTMKKYQTPAEERFNYTAVSTPEVSFDELNHRIDSLLDKPDEAPSSEDKLKDISLREGPYVIEPLQFGEHEDEGYNCIELYYFDDGILADDRGRIVDDISITIGEDCLSHFGEYENDAVYVRNERLLVDYLVYKQDETYQDYMKGRPPAIEL